MLCPMDQQVRSPSYCARGMQATRRPTYVCRPSCMTSSDPERRYMRMQRAGESLRATALVHEAFIRLHDARRVEWDDRNHFLAVAARTMRRVLVDLARAKASTKRGGRPHYVTLDDNIAAPEPEHAPIDLIALDDALDTLGAVDPRKVRVVELRFFAGLSVDETAAVLDCSPDTVARDWRMTRSWLLKQLDVGMGGR